MRKKLLLFFALLLVAATGAWAQADMLETPLTLEAKTAGTIVVSSPKSGMQYSKNGGVKTELTKDAGYNSSYYKWTITVAIGDEVQFFGNGTSIASYSGTRIRGGDADCYIYGNIMSLVDEDGYATATELTDDDAFSSLFYGNSHLYNHDTYELVLPATTLAESCYYEMFADCTNLTTAPELPATTLAERCYMYMFKGCTNLNSVTCLATNISATNATNDWLADVAASGTFTKAEGMMSWTTGASGIPSGWTVVDNVVLTDMKETPLTLQAMTAETIVVSSPKSGMQYSKNGGAKTELTTDAGYNSSYGVWTITVAAGDKVQFFGNGTSIASYYGTRISGGGADCYIYGNIMSLVDEDNFATATTLTGANAFGSLFSGNSHLYNHHTYKLVLPATTLATGCYYSMFAGCTNLTTAPELPATTLPTGCYHYMFSGCSNLNSVTCLATDISASYALDYWLEGVAATGTFTKALGMEGWTTGASGIPAGWTVTDMKKTPLTLEAKTAGTIKVSNPPIGMKYSKNGGAKTAVTSASIDVAIGDKVQFYGNGTSITSYGSNYVSITNGTADCYIYGNIMSLVDEEGFATANTLDNMAFFALFSSNTHLYNHDTYKLVLPATTLAESCYSRMFNGCSNLTTAPALPATTLAESCYNNMFNGCSKLTTAPALPATTLAEGCYLYMFNGCTNLTTAPELPATTLEESCYYCMFYGCTNLTTAPALPATTLADDCYSYMFYGCTNLTTAPALPATTLAAGCYSGMFSSCTNLTTAPELPATTLANYCYIYMFDGCANLNSVTCLATNIPSSSATNDWLVGVAPTGTFIKAAGMTGWPTNSASGIPDGWTVVDNVVLTDGSDPSALSAYAGQLCAVTYKRAFTADKPSTVCLPFAYAPKTGETFYTFTGITKDGDEYVATMTVYAGATLEANTPYLYKSAATGDTDFSGTYTLPAAITAGTTTVGDWKFVGTYTTQQWTEAPTGTYGFSAQDADGISQGEFVKVGAYVRVKPMRSYLMYKNGTEDYHSVRSFSGAPSTVSEPLPERIKVRFIDANGEVTGIGMLETQTGEVSFDPEAWYTLDGKRLSGKPTEKGIYVNNGKKVMIK